MLPEIGAGGKDRFEFCIGWCGVCTWVSFGPTTTSLTKIFFFFRFSICFFDPLRNVENGGRLA